LPTFQLNAPVVIKLFSKLNSSTQFKHSSYQFKLSTQVINSTQVISKLNWTQVGNR